VEKVWLGLAGLAGVAVSLLMGLWMQHVRERPVYERPAFLIRPGFRRIWLSSRAFLFLAGALLLVRASPPAAALLALLLAAAWSWQRYVGSRSHRRRMFRRAFDRERARDPATTDEMILQRLLASLHGRWGEELIEQIVADNPTPEGVADMVFRMERGALPAGFHPLPTLRRGR
jgi:hypothetical protein